MEPSPSSLAVSSLSLSVGEWASFPLTQGLGSFKASTLSLPHPPLDTHAYVCHSNVFFCDFPCKATQYNYICESIHFNPKNYETCAKVVKINSRSYSSKFHNYSASNCFSNIKFRRTQELDY